MKKNIIWLLAATICFASISCSHKVTSSLTAGEKQKSIVILYENDVHCGIDGYAKLAGLRDAINKSDTAYAAAVCVGDFLQGNTTGAISKGQYIIDIMKGVGYDAITLGNHEFDYGVPRQEELLRQVNAPVVCANFFEPSTPAPFYPAYVIKQYGPKRPKAIRSTTQTVLNSMTCVLKRSTASYSRPLTTPAARVQTTWYCYRMSEKILSRWVSIPICW